MFDNEIPDEQKREVLGKSENFPVVIITKYEDNQLRDAKKQSPSFGWQRYIDANIVVYDRGKGTNLKLEKEVDSIDKIFTNYTIRGKY